MPLIAVAARFASVVHILETVLRDGAAGIMFFICDQELVPVAVRTAP